MNYQEFKEAVMEAAKRQNIADYELYYANGTMTEVETYQDTIDRFAVNESGGACFRCVKDGKAGYAATELFTQDAAENLVAHALENAAVIESDDPIILKESGDVYQECTMKKLEEPDSTALKDFALQMQKKILAAEERVTDGSQAYIAFDKSERAIMNSKGLDLHHEYAVGVTYPMVIVAQDGEMYNAYEFYMGDLKNADSDELIAHSLEEAVNKISADSVKSGKYSCIFSGKMMGLLLNVFSGIFFADTAQKGLSLLRGREGEKIASDIVTLTDDPFYKDSCLQQPFDAEGSATYTKNVIENGTFQTFLSNLTTASKAGGKSTGNAGRASYASPISIAPYCFYLQPGTLSQEEMFAQMGDGLYITELNGTHAGANAITGDFSLSAAGYLIENGKKTRAVRDITVSDNFYELLKKICVVGSDLQFNLLNGTSEYGAPSTRVTEISVAGK